MKAFLVTLPVAAALTLAAFQQEALALACTLPASVLLLAGRR